MSRYIDSSQLLKAIGISARSADDPWTLTKNPRGTIKGSPFSPAVIADLGAPARDLVSRIEASDEISHADAIGRNASRVSEAPKPAAGGFLGGLFDFFPLASGIAKLFGAGTSAEGPALAQFEPVPSISFEGALSNASEIAGLSYGQDGLPREISHQAGTSGSPRSAAQIADTRIQEPLFMNSDAASEVQTLASRDVLSETWAGDPKVSSQYVTTPVSNHGDELAVTRATDFTGNEASRGAGVPPGGSDQAQSILVQVQAMDSQSFMDRSHDIAQAVRQAMLNMHSVNDVILDL
jgi:hypothetical protein